MTNACLLAALHAAPRRSCMSAHAHTPTVQFAAYLLAVRSQQLCEDSLHLPPLRNHSQHRADKHGAEGELRRRHGGQVIFDHRIVRTSSSSQHISLLLNWPKLSTSWYVSEAARAKWLLGGGLDVRPWSRSAGSLNTPTGRWVSVHGNESPADGRARTLQGDPPARTCEVGGEPWGCGS